MSFTAVEPTTLHRERLDCDRAPHEVLAALRDQPWPFALTGRWAGGGAIVGSAPLVVADPATDPFAVFDSLPPMEGAYPDGAVGGGWFGWLGYRLGRRIERIRPGPPRPVPLPEFHLAYYDHVLRLDADGQWWFEALVSPGRLEALERRRDELERAFSRDVAGAAYEPPPPFLLTRADREHHLRAVQDCRRRIAAGEIFQANVCLRLESRWPGEPTELYSQAIRCLEPDYGAAFRTPWGGVASLSPELFLRRVASEVVTAPIKGTVARVHGSDQGLDALRQSPKDAAEHVMIVDLMRNDLGRVCAYGSIEAPLVPDAEAHPGVWHLVSRVRGTLRPDARDRDLLRATFPPGSVTGAPKVQAMQVIAELERTDREVYTGAIGFASPLSGLELSVAIRTFELRDGRLWLGVGGGIVADSDPERELEEALVKARPLVQAIGSSLRSE